MKCSICDQEIEADSTTETCPECLRVVVANSVEEPDEPDEGDWITEDHIVFRECGGKGVIRIPLGGPWQPAVRDRMEREQFWPNVWLLSDHGNYHLMSLDEEE